MDAHPDAHLKESKVDGKLVYEGHFLKVQRDTIRLPDGKQSVREHIRHPGAVVILPLFDDGSVLLERQFRYPLDQVFIERSMPAKITWSAPSASCGKKPATPRPTGNSFAPFITRLPIRTSTWTSIWRAA